MRRIILAGLLAIFILCGCGSKKVVDAKIISTNYTPEHTEMVTDYNYRYNVFSGEFVLVPNVHTETFSEEYEVLYLYTYDDGTTRKEWQTVDRDTYLEAVERGRE